MIKKVIIKNHTFIKNSNVIGSLTLKEDGTIIFNDGLSFYVGTSYMVDEVNMLILQNTSSKLLKKGLFGSSHGYRPSEFCEIYLPNNITYEEFMLDEYLTTIKVGYTKTKKILEGLKL